MSKERCGMDCGAGCGETTMKFTVSFNCDNAAFDEDLNGAIARVLRHVANQVADYGAPLSSLIKDRNGNTIGMWRLEDDE